MLDRSSSHDVIVVGGGPGGVAAAISAARRGARVVLLDRARFPRAKVCGDGVTPLGMAMLAELGLADRVRAIAGSGVRELALGDGADIHRVPLAGELLVVPRRQLDAALLDAAREAVAVHERAAVDRVLVEAGQVVGVAGVSPHGRFELRAPVVIGADGATSRVAREVGGDGRSRDRLVATRAYVEAPTAERAVAELHFLAELEGGYAWIFPVGRGVYNVGLGVRTAASIAALRAAVLAPLLDSRLPGARTTTSFRGGIIPLTRPGSALSGDGFLLVGDAAGLADPFWGDGIDTALLSGVLAGAHAAAAARRGNASAAHLAAYDRGITRLLGQKLATGAALRRTPTLDLHALATQLTTPTAGQP